MDIAAARAFFPGTRDQVFLDAACVSLLPTQAEEALRRLTQDLLRCPGRDASAHDVALVESTTQGLQAVAAAVPLGRGDVVLVGETEFLGLAVPWIGRQQSDGFHVRTVPHRGGRLLVDDFARAIDSHTRLILLSSVQW